MKEGAAVLPRLNDSDIVFLTPDQFAKLPQRWADIAISNLAEMTRPQVDLYLALLDEKIDDLVYMKQWLEQHNEHDEVHYTRSDFDMGAGRRKINDRGDPVQTWFFETLWRRIHASA